MDAHTELDAVVEAAHLILCSMIVARRGLGRPAEPVYRLLFRAVETIIAEVARSEQEAHTIIEQATGDGFFARCGTNPISSDIEALTRTTLELKAAVSTLLRFPLTVRKDKPS